MAEPHSALGYINLFYDWNWSESERHFKRSIELNPRYQVAHQWYGNFLTPMERFDEAVREMQIGMELDPLSLINSAALGWVYYYAGKYEKAIEQYNNTLKLEPSFILAHFWMGQAYQELGQFDEALEKLEYVQIFPQVEFSQQVWRTAMLCPDVLPRPGNSWLSLKQDRQKSMFQRTKSQKSM